MKGLYAIPLYFKGRWLQQKIRNYNTEIADFIYCISRGQVKGVNFKDIENCSVCKKVINDLSINPESLKNPALWVQMWVVNHDSFCVFDTDSNSKSLDESNYGCKLRNKLLYDNKFHISYLEHEINEAKICENSNNRCGTNCGKYCCKN